MMPELLDLTEAEAHEAMAVLSLYVRRVPLILPEPTTEELPA